ncbi:MAG: PEP-CTERM sorting domain-containing protein [Phormidium sp.]
MRLPTAITYTAPILSASLALGALAAPATAFSMNSGEKFGTDGLLFTEDTEVTFDFGKTFGAYVASLGVYEVDGTNTTEVKSLFTEQWATDIGKASSGDDWLGTCGEDDSTVANCTASFVFKANVEYALGLANWSRTGEDNVAGSYIRTVFSTDRLNSFDGEETQQFLFGSHGAFDGQDSNEHQAFSNPEEYVSGDPLAGSLALGIDDRGNGDDLDFQDMVLSAQAERTTDVPEPSVIFGLTAIAGGFASLRRRRDS